jgi:RNA polymerase sigma-70 factor (ECF subfamily)
MVVVQGMSYEELAGATGCAVGTAKSRVFRARRQLEAWLLGECSTGDDVGRPVTRAENRQRLALRAEQPALADIVTTKPRVSA